MTRESSFALKVCDWVAKYSIYAAIFLTPLFFLPWTSEVLDFNKQALLIFLAVVSFFAWVLGVLISGKLELNIDKIHIFVGVLFLAYVLSTVFSVYRYGSFWGWPQITSESLLSIVAIFLFYFLASNIFSKKDIFTSTIVLFFSAIIAELIGAFQLLGWFIFPATFSKSVLFNTIGSVGSLGFFAAILLPLSVLLLMSAKKWWKALFISEIVVSAVVLFLINYTIVWWVVIVSAALIIVLGSLKRDFFDTRWMALPMFFLAISLFFMLLSPQVSWLGQRANEVFLSQGASAKIALQSIKERPIFGSGLGTFAYDFSKFKDPDFSKSSLWSATFNRGSSKFLNDLATTGILGILAFWALIVYSVFRAVKFLIKEKEINTTHWILLAGFSLAFITQAVTYFLYNSNVVLDMLLFFLLAGIVIFITQEKKVYELKSSSLATLIMTFVFTLVFIFGLGIVILDGQRYTAEVNYYKGLVELQTGKTDEGAQNLEIAASQNPASDLYFRQLSQVYLLQLQNEVQKVGTANPTDDEKNRMQALVANAVNAGKIATDINPKNVSNWSVRGYVYQNLFGVVSDAGTWAANSYDEASKLDPNNPYIFAQQGNVNLVSALRATTESDQKDQFLSKAKEQLEKAINLNPNYSDALYLLGLVYDQSGQKDKAIEEFTKLQQLNPQNTDISKVLENLKAGKSALQSTTPPPATPPAESSSESSVKNPPEETEEEATKTKK